jgi:hypothetical protein
MIDFEKTTLADKLRCNSGTNTEHIRDIRSAVFELMEPKIKLLKLLESSKYLDLPLKQIKQRMIADIENIYKIFGDELCK